MRAGRSQPVTGCVLALAVVLVLLLLGQAIGEWTDPPPGQPAQIWSQVNYDPKLSDPFFESEQWTSSDYAWEEVNDRTVLTRKKCPSHRRKELQCLKNTARVFSSPMREHIINFCHATLLEDGTIKLSIRDDESYILEGLGIVVEKDRFMSGYGYAFKLGPDWRCVTKKQKLTLDKQAYSRGGVIKGRIDFECLGTGENPKPIFLKGVFKTILK